LEIVSTKDKAWVLSASDRCDTGDCSAQAFVQAIGVSGDLLFCAHHYKKIADNAPGYAALEQFAYKIINETGRLVENRLQGDN
jgi:hypothetical protein